MKEILSGKLSNDGYKEFVNFLRVLVLKHNWPKYILEEIQYSQEKSFWNDQDFINLANQFILYLLTKNKIEFLLKINTEARYSYLSTILMRYVADKINAKQKEFSISYRQVKDAFDLYVSKDDKYISQHLRGRNYYSLIEYNQNDPLSEAELEIYFRNISFSHLDITYNKKVSLAEYIRALVNYILEFVASPIQEDILLNYIHSKINELYIINKQELNNNFSEVSTIDSLSSDEYSNIYLNILSLLNVKEQIVLKKYFFNQDQLTLLDAERELMIPKSTISYISNKISHLIRDNFSPKSTQDAILFLKHFEFFLENS